MQLCFFNIGTGIVSKIEAPAVLRKPEPPNDVPFWVLRLHIMSWLDRSPLRETPQTQRPHVGPSGPHELPKPGVPMNPLNISQANRENYDEPDKEQE